MSAKKLIIYLLLGLLVPPIGFVLMLGDDRVPRYVCALCAAWCAVVIIVLIFAGSCRGETVFTGRQL